MVIAVIAVLLSLAAIIPGIVTLINPQSFKLKSRWYALPMLTGFIAAFGVMFLVMPDQEDIADVLRIIGFSFLAMWAGLFHLARVKAGAVGLPDAMKQAASPDRTPEQVDQRTNQVRRERLEKQQAESEAYRQIELEKAFNAGRAAAARELERPKRSHHKKRPEPEVDADPSVPRHSSGQLAQFVYVDADGVVTTRKVKRWSSDDKYIEGQCQTRKEHRTFRLDRIEEWISG